VSVQSLTVWMWLRAVPLLMRWFADRYLDRNQISSIDSGAFAVLTALTRLYGTGLWAVFAAFCLCCLPGSAAEGLVPHLNQWEQLGVNQSPLTLAYLICSCTYFSFTGSFLSLFAS
jgi:hypothetical protein